MILPDLRNSQDLFIRSNILDALERTITEERDETCRSPYGEGGGEARNMRKGERGQAHTRFSSDMIHA